MPTRARTASQLATWTARWSRLALVGAVPTLSWIEAFTTAPLTAAAPRWSATADLWEQSFTQLARDVLRPGGAEWTGDGAEAAQDSTDQAAMTARGASNQLRDAATIATFGADQLDGLHAKTVAAIAETCSDGFQVNEDLSVIDTRRVPLCSNEYAARQAQAEAHAETVKSYAGQLLALDIQYATKLDAATAGLDTLALETPGCVRTATEPTRCPVPGCRDANSHPVTQPGTRRLFPARRHSRT